MTLELLIKEYAVCRLNRFFFPEGEFVSLTVCGGEISLVCENEQVPPDCVAERGWRAFRVSGVLDFSMIGVLAGLTDALATAGISVFAISTYDTDYLFVKAHCLSRAVQAFNAQEHIVTGV